MAKKLEDDSRRYRLEVMLPRDLSQNLEIMKKEIWEETGKRVTKSGLVREILKEFFEKK